MPHFSLLVGSYLFIFLVWLVSCFGHLANGSPMIFNAISEAKESIATCTAHLSGFGNLF